jgi:uncharacterized protein
MRITVTGASGLIGSKLVEHLRSRGDEVTTLSRNPSSPDAVAWQPEQEPAPTAALSGRDAVVHLAGEPVAQRWSDDAKHRIRESRELGTRNLVAGIEAADPRPGVLVSSSAVGIYGPHGEERLDEDTPPGHDFLAEVCVMWEREARQAAGLGVRVVCVRTGVVLDQGGGALAKMLPFFKLGVGGPVAGGEQYMPWIHVDDVVGIYLAALDGHAWHGAVNASAPEPSPPSRSARSTARWRRSSRRASAWCRRPRSSTGTRSRTPTSTRPSRPRSVNSAQDSSGGFAAADWSAVCTRRLRGGTAPSVFQSDPARAGIASQTTTATADSSRPVAKPGFSP